MRKGTNDDNFSDRRKINTKTHTHTHTRTQVKQSINRHHHPITHSKRSSRNKTVEEVL